MTGPIWMASPPEVHSALLSSGPGVESLVSSAGALDSLSAEYASAAEELDALLAAVQAGAWQGPSAESYVAAHVPYLAWLMQASADSAATAAQHEAAAAAYTTALAAMPTLVELAANHITHALLVATNFFGINTISIALNEADYARMWIQAATTMATYQTVSSTAVASTPRTTPAPRIQKAASNNSGGSHDEGPGPHDPSWWTERIGKVITAFENELTNPNSTNGQVLYSTLTYWIPRWSGEVYLTFAPQLTELSELSFGLIAPAAMGGFAGMAGLAGLSGAAPAPMPVGPVEAAAPANIGPVATAAPTLGAPAAASAPAPLPASAPAAIPAPGSALPPPPPTAAAQGFGYPYLVGPPGVGSGARMSVGAAVRRSAPEPDTTAAAAGAATEEQARRRRHRTGLVDRGYRHEYLDPDFAVAASDRGAGALGFAGTAPHADGGQAAGLTTLAGDSFGRGPAMPMMPSTWGADVDAPATGDAAPDK